MEVLKRSVNDQIFNFTELKTESESMQLINNDYLTIVQESDISVGENHEIYSTEDANLITRSVPINVINISDDHILRIEFQNGSNLQNTEFIIGDNVLNTEFITQCTELKEIEVPSDNETAQNHSENNENELLSAVESLSKYNVNESMPSPETDEELPSETDLTSLNWLHNITNIMSVPNLPTPPISPPPNLKRCNKNSGNCQEDLTINIDFYKKNGDKKPPFSYATLICMAMSKNGNKMTLSAIYSWIRESFLYYRKAHPSWQVRHFY